ILPSPVVKFLHRRDPDALALQLGSQSFVDLAHRLVRLGAHYFAQFKQPLPHAQTRPSINNSRKTRTAINAPISKPVKATANGTRKIASTSKIKKMIA